MPGIVDDPELVARLRAGDEAAFAAVIDTYYASMLHVARCYVATREAAEDVAQEALLGVVRGIDRFEARASFKTWLFHIVANRARTRGERESRTRPFSAFANTDGDEPSVDPRRFHPDGEWVGHWQTPPNPHELPDGHLVAVEIGDRLRDAIEQLPAAQRSVVVLRDVHGLSAAEVCELLGLSDANQRVVLHRARAKLRQLLESYLDERDGGTG